MKLNSNAVLLIGGVLVGGYIVYKIKSPQNNNFAMNPTDTKFYNQTVEASALTTNLYNTGIKMGIKNTLDWFSGSNFFK